MSTFPSQLDATVEIVTPENIAFQYRVAGPFRRFPAFLLDLLLRVGIFCLGIYILAWLPFGGGAFAGIYGAGMLILWFLLDWFYGGIFETFWNGQTPGKAVMRVRVLTVDGQPINGMQAVMRNIFRYADFFPLLPLQIFPGVDTPYYAIPTFLVGFGAMMLTRRYQRLGDLVCGTVVVTEERQWLAGIAKLEDARVAQLAAYLPADYQVSRSMARSLAAYVDRRRFFSRSRRLEVAQHLGKPLVREFGLPSNTSHDLLLCSLYYKAFVADRGEEGESPFSRQAAGASGPPGEQPAASTSRP